ncbi:MAG: DEAD/DEAH box helicase [Nitrosopumilus sp. H8]|nr:MAG: DEAD/DEAH box helicase [Nitrosopumilus sp. H8]
MAYIEKRYVKKDSIERREYQVSLAEQAAAENCIVVLPTGLGKTAIALQVIAEYLAKGRGGALFLAPTRVLVNQHYEFLRECLTLEDISLITGGGTVQKRTKLWNNSVVCATPEIARNDLGRGIVSSGQFSLVIFDEVHRTVGDYAYSGIAARFEDADARIVGMTATLPSEIDKATEILTKLRISSVAERTEESPDVKEYTQETKTEWESVDLPPELVAVQTRLKVALDKRYAMLRGNPNLSVGQQSLSALLRLRPQIIYRERRSAMPLFAAIRIHYALNILEAHGITPFLKFCGRTKAKKGSGIKNLFEDADIVGAMRIAKEAQESGIEHSKIPKLEEIMRKSSGKTLIFTSYRDSVDMIHEHLTGMGIPSVALVGKAGETGLNQKKQIEAVQGFRDGRYRAMIATRVGEEGLDIEEVNQVIFYDNVPSSIRFVQRRGRTGRKSTGRLIVLIAKNTIDERYRWIGNRKIKAAKSMGDKMAGVLEQNRESAEKLDKFM